MFFYLQHFFVKKNNRNVSIIISIGLFYFYFSINIYDMKFDKKSKNVYSF